MPGCENAGMPFSQRSIKADRAGEAMPYYRKALTLAQTAEPRFQQSLIKQLQQRIASNP